MSYSCSRCGATVEKRPGRGRPPLCPTCRATPRPYLRRLSLIFVQPCAADDCSVLVVTTQPAGRFCSKRCNDRTVDRRRRNDPARWRARLDKSVHMHGKRRTGMTATESDLTPQDVRDLKAAATFCPLCGCALSDEATSPNARQVDHIVPVAEGGRHVHSNVRVICATCNRRRPRDGSDATLIC